MAELGARRFADPDWNIASVGRNLLDEPRPDGAVVLVGHGGAHVPAGKVSRDDVAECVVCGTFAPNAGNATVGVAGSFKPTGGVTTEMSWDPARGKHYRAVEVDANVMEGTDVAEMMTKVGPDDDILERKTYEPFVARFTPSSRASPSPARRPSSRLARWVVARRRVTSKRVRRISNLRGEFEPSLV